MLGKNIALQGELCGPGINGNMYQLKEHKFFMFDTFDCDTYSYYTHAERMNLCQQIAIDHVPVLYSTCPVSTEEFNVTVLLEEANHVGRFGVPAEGIVYKSHCGKHSFKVISNTFLLNSKFA